MVSNNSTHIDQAITSSQTGWRRLVLQPSFYAYLVSIFFLLDTIIAILLHPVDFTNLLDIELIQISFLIASITCFGLTFFLKKKQILIYVMLLLIMSYPALIIRNDLMDLRMSVHYVPIAFLIQVGQQNKKLSYKAFIILTLIMLVFFLFLVLKPTINIDVTSVELKIQIVISVLYSALLILFGILVQKARSYYITIEKDLIDQIGYVTETFSKITSLQPSLDNILRLFEEKTAHFFDQSNCSFILSKNVQSDAEITTEEQDQSTYFQDLISSESNLIRYSIRNGKSILIGNTTKNNFSSTLDKKFKSVLLVPILYKEEVLGVIYVSNTSPYFFNESHLHLTEIIASLCSSKILEYQNRQLKYQAIELELESQQLQELDELKYNFIENLSRNIKSPIQSILANTTLLDKDLKDGHAQKLLQLINSNGSQLKGILDQLLQLNEIDVTSVELQLEEIDLGHLIYGWKSTFQRISERKNIELTITGPSSLTVITDEKKITSIIHNLVNNALKYTPENGTVQITYGLRENQFSFHVNDSGMGIPEKYREKIFDRFFRLGEADGKGTGIGLSIVKELTDILGGEIIIDSSPLGGASFQFSYNVSYVEGLYPPNVQDYTQNQLEVVSSDKPLVLVIDDHDEMREFICNCLASDFNCVQATNGKTGLELAMKIVPDLIITDLMMPEMNGEQLCTEIRSDVKLNHIPIVVLSAKSMGVDKINLYEIGADNYLVKPFEVDELKAILQSLIQIRNQLREQFKSQFSISDSIEETYESKDNIFLKKVSEIIFDNMDNSDFNVLMLCNKLSLGRNQLARKIKALTNMTPVEFIRETRLKEASIILKETDLSISEIAYKTGFNNLSYFTKTFKKTYKCLPSEYRIAAYKE